MNTTFASRLARQAASSQKGTDAEVASSDPTLSLAILTCMDARLDLAARLGIAIGDAHILRNAGGRMTPDTIRSLLVSVKLMNVREIGILHHTNCGLHGADNDTLIQRIGAGDIDYLPFQSYEDSLMADITTVLNAGILPVGGVVWGALYSLESECISLTHGPKVVTETGNHAACLAVQLIG